MREESLQLARQTFKIEADCILRGLEYFDEDSFSRAVEALKNARCIGTTGCGHSGILAQHFAHLLCCIELSARFISPAEAIHGATGFLKEGDAMVFASRGGQTEELFPILDICEKKRVIRILITEKIDSKLAQRSDIVLKQFVTREIDPGNIQGTTSSVALCAVFHALQSALVLETGFCKEQFSIIHPGGAVGARLNS